MSKAEMAIRLAARTGRNARTGEGVSAIDVDFADIQAREDAGGCREGWPRVMTLQRQATATRSDVDRLDVESSRLLCDDGRSASYGAGAEDSQANSGVDGWAGPSLDAA